MVMIGFERFTRLSLSAPRPGLRVMFRRVLVPAFVIAGALCAVPTSAQDSPFSDCKIIEPVQTRSRGQMPIEGRPGAFRVVMEGTAEVPVRIVCDALTLQATSITYETD